MTQAVNLANFANNLDSSGGVTPSALNASVPISKGGTNAATASAARTNLGVDYVTLGQLMYPVGSIYINATNATNPATLLGFGTWSAFGAGRVPVGVNAADPLFDTPEETGGSKDAVLVSHTHTATVTDPGHSHTYTRYSTFLNQTGSATPVWYATATANTSVATTGITVSNSTVGESATNKNLQPYITVYMWKRVS